MLVVRAAGQDPRRFGGRDLIADIMRHRDRDGSFDGYVSYSSFAILALRRSGVSASSGTIRKAATWIERHQNADGGFNVGGRGASSIDDTGYAVQALVAAGRRASRSTRRAAAFLAGPRAPRAASRSRAAARRTRSPRPTPCRPSWPPGATRPRCAAARPTCAR